MKKIFKISFLILCILTLNILTGCTKKYTVTFKDYDGTLLKEEIVKKGDDAIAPNNPSREGYTFIGWNQDYTNIKKDIVVVAQYELINQGTSTKIYTVTFEDYDGTILKKETVQEGKNAIMPSDPERIGYNFIGWSQDFTNVTSNLIVIAQYEQKKQNEFIDAYTVTFVTNNDTTIENQKVKKGEKAIEPEKLTKYGYDFDGWYLDNEKWSFIGYSVTKNITLEAKWILRETKGLEYELSSDISYYIVTGIDHRTHSEIIIPLLHNNIPVKKIGKAAFSYCTNLINIEIPNSVTSIGDYAFYECDSLTSIIIPNTVRSIGDYAFESCSNLTSIEIGDSVTSIGDYAFSDCRRLTSIEIPNSVTSIGEYVFSYCISLENVYYNGTIEDWCNITFYSSYSNPMYYVEHRYMLDENNEYYEVTEIAIPETVTSIGSYQFYGFNNITSIEIPNSVTSIGESAFSGCTSLESITIPFVGNKLNGISDTHFGYIFGASSWYYNYAPTSLKEVIITGGTWIGLSAFYNCTSLTSIEIPNSVTSIGSYAFEGCTSLTSVEIGDSVTSIGDYAFRGCTSLESIEIPNSVTSIGNYAFYNCTSLTSVEIGDSVTSIGQYAFYNCTSLTSVVIGDSVTSIGYDAFYNCTSLTSVEIGDSVTSIGRSAFYNCTSLTSITIPFVGNTLNGTSNTYFGYIFGASSYSNNNNYVPTSLKEVIITGGTSIGESAFYNCTSLTSVEIGDSVTSIGEYVFYRCTSLTSVEIGDSVISIGQSAFRGCTSLTSVEIGDSVTSIRGSAFSGCTSLENVYYNGTIDDWCKISFSSYDSNPMYYAEHIYMLNDNNEYYEVKEIVIPEAVTSIGNYQFSGFDNLTNIEIGDSVTSIESYAFSGCTSLTSVVIGDSVTSIRGSAFSGCTSLTSIEIPNSVTSIGTDAFRGCTKLKTIIIPNTVISIGTSAFYNCTSLTSIEIPNSVTSIGERAFYNCTSLTINCEVTTKPSGWDFYWNYSNCPVVWGYVKE